MRERREGVADQVYVGGWGLSASALVQESGTLHLHASEDERIEYVSDATGAIVERVEWRASGALRVASGAGIKSESALGVRALYLGAPYFGGMEAHRLGARWYRPSWGQFTTRDPLGPVDGANPFVYAGGQAHVSMDPSGLALEPLAKSLPGPLAGAAYGLVVVSVLVGGTVEAVLDRNEMTFARRNRLMAGYRAKGAGYSEEGEYIGEALGTLAVTLRPIRALPAPAVRLDPGVELLCAKAPLTPRLPPPRLAPPAVKPAVAEGTPVAPGPATPPTGLGAPPPPGPGAAAAKGGAAPPLPEYAGGKTSGVLRTPQGDTPLISGYKGPSADMPRGTPGMNGNIKSHVEGSRGVNHAPAERSGGDALHQSRTVPWRQWMRSHAAANAPRRKPAARGWSQRLRPHVHGTAGLGLAMYQISWDQEAAVTMNDANEVDRELTLLAAQFQATTPTLVSVERQDTGDTLSIGLGLDRSVLNYVRGDKDPPYFCSVDESIEGDDGLVEFRFGGEVSEYPLRNTVPVESARAAMRYFCQTGELANCVAWEEV